MAIDHDQLFKTLIREFFREFIELFLPDHARLMDFDSVEFLEQETFTDVVHGRRRELDLVAKVGLQAGGEEFVLVHGEFEGTVKDMDFARRMCRYGCQLFLRYDRPVIPIGLFADDAVWKDRVPNQFELGFAGETYLSFRYCQLKLKHMDYREYLASSNPVAFALMAKMNYDKGQRVRLKADFLRLISGAPINPARRSILLEFIEAYMTLGQREQQEFDRIIEQDQNLTEVKKMLTIYERRGIEKGRAEGRVEGKQDDLILFLEARFGTLPAELAAKIRAEIQIGRLNALVKQAATIDVLDQLSI